MLFLVVYFVDHAQYQKLFVGITGKSTPVYLKVSICVFFVIIAYNKTKNIIYKFHLPFYG